MRPAPKKARVVNLTAESPIQSVPDWEAKKAEFLKKFDKDGDGKISAEEKKAIAEEWKKRLGDRKFRRPEGRRPRPEGGRPERPKRPEGRKPRPSKKK